MTERLRTNPYGTYCQGNPRAAPQSSDEGLGTKKTMLVIVVVVGCFAVLWPKLFYPMLVSNANGHIKPGPVDKTTGCCDVISELDVDTIKIMSELCSTIIDRSDRTPPTPKEIVSQCKKAVLETCGIDISAALQDRISLGHSAKQILEEVRSLNGSLCLKYNFGVSPWMLGVPHRVNVHLDPAVKQERSSHMRPGMVHPAFRERGRAIPESDTSAVPRRSSPPPRIVEGRPGPIPGMRPAMGGPGHVVPPSKQSYGFMGVLMPIYTVGFAIFFSYTIMKLVFKKKPEAYAGDSLYPPCETDEQFRKDVFEANRHYFNRPNKDTSKIGDEELDQLRKRLRETELAMERIVHQMTQAPLVTQDEIRPNGSLPKEEEQGSVTVMAMETTASSESGKKWSRPDSPTLPHPQPAPPKEPSPPPQQIFLEGALPPQSQLLVADSATEAQKGAEDDSSVVLAGKMTLSVISLDSETGTEDLSNSGRKAEPPKDELRRSGSNTSEEFEKINAADLEDQINDIIEEAENIALAEETRYSPEREELPKAPQINDKEADSDILEEIKNQFNLEDDLLQALKEREPEGKVGLPVTDIIKEFLSNEENILLAEALDEKPTEIVESQEDPAAIQQEQQIPEATLDIEEDLSNEEHILLEEALVAYPIDIAESQELTTEDPVASQQEQQIPEANLDIEEALVAYPTDIAESQELKTEDPSVASQQEQQIPEATLDIEEDLSNEAHILLEEALVAYPTDIVESQKLEAEDPAASPEANLDIEEELSDNEHQSDDNPAEIVKSQEVEAEEPATSQEEEHIAEVNLLDGKAAEIVDNRDLEAARSQEEAILLKDDNSTAETSLNVVESLEPNTQEETTAKKNMADLLLQGLLVKDDDPEEDSEQLSLVAEPPTPELSKREQLQTEEEEEEAQDVEEQMIEDIEYNDDSEDELRYEDRESVEGRVNGEDGAGNSETAAENEISEDDSENEADEDIEEIIEYVDNTDEEGEEIIEINGNERRHLNENDAN